MRSLSVVPGPVEFPKPDHSEHADHQPKQDLITGEHHQQRNCPKRDRADETQNESGTRRDRVCAGLLEQNRLVEENTIAGPPRYPV